MSSTRGAPTVTGDGNIRGPLSTFRRMWLDTKIWTTTETGAIRRNTATSGTRGLKWRTGRLITTATGRISSLGDIPGLMISLGASRHFITDAG